MHKTGKEQSYENKMMTMISQTDMLQSNVIPPTNSVPQSQLQSDMNPSSHTIPQSNVNPFMQMIPNMPSSQMYPLSSYSAYATPSPLSNVYTNATTTAPITVPTTAPTTTSPSMRLNTGDLSVVSL